VRTNGEAISSPIQPLIDESLRPLEVVAPSRHLTQHV
jgi:hypothetical protein